MRRFFEREKSTIVDFRLMLSLCENVIINQLKYFKYIGGMTYIRQERKNNGLCAENAGTEGIQRIYCY